MMSAVKNQLHPFAVCQNSSENPIIPPGANDCSFSIAAPGLVTSVESVTNFNWNGLSSARIEGKLLIQLIELPILNHP